MSGVMNDGYDEGAYRIYLHYETPTGKKYTVRRGPFASLSKAKAERTRYFTENTREFAWHVQSLERWKGYSFTPPAPHKLIDVTVQRTSVDWQDVEL